MRLPEAVMQKFLKTPLSHLHEHGLQIRDINRLEDAGFEFVRDIEGISRQELFEFVGWSGTGHEPDRVAAAMRKLLEHILKGEPMETKHVGEFETFDPIISNFSFSCLLKEQPFQDNSGKGANIRKFRVTVEEIVEPGDVLRDRLLTLWRGCDEPTHRKGLLAEGKRLGINLEEKPYVSQYGSHRKEKLATGEYA